jgi:hypothetical protein
MHLAQLGGAEEAVLVELRLHEPECQPRRPDRTHVDLAHQVRERTHVVLVAVRQDDRADRGPALPEVREVGKHEIDPEVLVARKREPGVHEDDRAVALVRGHVLADLTEAAERDDPARFGHSESLSGRIGGPPVGPVRAR